MTTEPATTPELPLPIVDTATNPTTKVEKAVNKQFASAISQEEEDYIERAHECLSELRRALAALDWDRVDELLGEMLSYSKVSRLNKLHTACGYGFAPLVEKYLAEGQFDANGECDFNEPSGITPLHFCAGIGPDALTNDRAKCVQLLVDKGADVNRRTSRNDTPLHWATKLADASVVAKLVSCGADVNKVNNDNCTCAHGAAFYKKFDIIETLLNAGIDVNVKDVSGKTIMHLLCKDSFEEQTAAAAADSNGDLAADTQAAVDEKKFCLKTINRLLDEFNVDLEARDDSDFTALMYACENNHMELIETLIAHKANLHVINKDEVTCMLLAVINSLPSVVKFLLKSGFDVVRNEGEHCSYITDAAYLSDLETLNLLLDAGCDVNRTKQDESGAILNALWAAVEKAHVDVVEALLARGAHTVIIESLNMTALHCCAMAQQESLSIAKLLVQNKCPINMKSSQAGETPMFLACNSGYLEIAEYLLELGVDPNDCSPPTRTCFQQSFFRGHRDITMLLINKGYKLTDDDRDDMPHFIVDLFQEHDVEMLNFMLTHEFVDKAKILEYLAHLHAWQRDKLKAMAEASATEVAANQAENDEKRAAASTTAVPLPALTDLDFGADMFPSTIDELDAYLSLKCNLNASHSSEDNEEAK